MTFLAEREPRPVVLPEPLGFQRLDLYMGRGASALEVTVARLGARPTAAAIRSAWGNRRGGRPTPVVLVALYNSRAAVVGPAGDTPPAYLDVEPSKVERICAAALDEPDRHAALRFLTNALPELQSATSGLRNEGLFATHELVSGVPSRTDWAAATASATPLLTLRERELLRRLGFAVEPLEGPAYVLRAADTRTALAVLLDRQESPDLPNNRFSNQSPISYALAKADAENLEYVVMIAGPAIRLYPVKTGVGTGQRGRTETFAELRLDLLAESQAGYLWLLFSAGALCRGGTVAAILDDSGRYAAELGARLRERIYNEVVPQLAQALLDAREIRRWTAANLAQTYQMALVILFRLLFIAYAEDKELLPYKTNEFYRDRSLKKKAGDLTKLLRDGHGFSTASTAHWEEIERLFRAVDEGQAEWGVPKYNGGLFSSVREVSRIGAEIATLRIPDSAFGPPLTSLLVDRTPEGPGPVDFRSLGVREFGTVYEGLLENELSIADTDLATEISGKVERYRPAKRKDEIRVPRGRPFLHNTSGARKSTGSYFTKHFAVEHLLEHGLEPALASHFEHLDTLPDREAGDALFDFRIADITMGSGHFLVAAVDRMERAFSLYLVKRPLPEVTDELHRLRSAALEALRGTGFEGDIGDGQLLRRQIARRCVYGVDVNPTAVDLARLALWVHTFVPGLPLSFLDHNLVAGNSLVGIATIKEANEWLRQVAGPLFGFTADVLVGSAHLALSRLARLSDATGAEIQRARDAFHEAGAAVQPAAALFDILSAARLDDGIRQHVFQDASHWKDDLSPLPGSAVHKAARAVLAAIPPLHFPVAFPEVFLRHNPGFNVIVGNPPWEEATVEEDRFWARHHPGFHGLKQKDQEALKKQLRRERPDLVTELGKESESAELLRRALLTGPFPGMGTGDPDTYKASCWRFWGLVRERGHVGVVLPRSAFSAKGSADFRRAVFSGATFDDLTFLLNRGGWVFDDAEHRDTMALVAFRREQATDAGELPLRGPYSTMARFASGTANAAFRFKVADVLSWTDTAALPLLPSDESAEIFAQLRKAPRLDLNDVGSWRARPHAELHATNDKPLMTFASEPPDGFWPVFKGETFDIWEPDTGSYYAWADPEKVLPALQASRVRSARLARSAFAEFPRTLIADPESLPCLNPRVAFRDVSRATDTRTVRAALLPPRVFITNKGPYFLWPRGDMKDEAFLLGVLCSLPLDWYARRFVEISLNYHILDPFPVPRPHRDSLLWTRTVEISGRLACPDKRYAKWAKAVGVEHGRLSDDEKQDMIHELDAVVAHLYGLGESQLRHVFETFHEGWDFGERLEATIGHFRKWQKKL